MLSKIKRMFSRYPQKVKLMTYRLVRKDGGEWVIRRASRPVVLYNKTWAKRLIELEVEHILARAKRVKGAPLPDSVRAKIVEGVRYTPLDE